MAKEQLLALAEELISKLRDRDLYIVNKNNQYYCDVCIRDLKSIELYNSNSPGTYWILSSTEILKSEEALKCLFAWGINDALSSKEEEAERQKGNAITITPGVGTINITPMPGTISGINFRAPDGSSFAAIEVNNFPDSYY